MNSEEELIQGMEIAAKRGAQYNIEALNEELIPTLMILTKDDRIEVAHIAAEREHIPGILKEWLIIKQAKAYTLILEAWSTSFVEKAMALEGRVRDMPLDDRFEVTNIIMVKRNEGITKYLSARIDTKSDGNRKLREWEIGTVQDSRICITKW
jgi:hypothetical protein